MAERSSMTGPGAAWHLARARTTVRPALHRAHSRLAVKDLYASDHADPRRGGRFRWLMSTFLAAAVGAVAILVVIYGSSDPKETPDGLLPTLKRMGEAAPEPGFGVLRRRQEGLIWQVPRADKLQVTSGAMSTRYTIHEMRRQRVAGRDKIYAKRFVRIVSRLTPVPPSYADVIPPFNPFRLFANSNPVGTNDAETESAETRDDVAVKVVELHGGILPEEDGQELAETEVVELVERTENATDPTNDQTPVAGAGSALAAGMPSAADLENAQNLAILVKSDFDTDDDTPGTTQTSNVTTVTVDETDTLSGILIASGAEKWQAAAMIEAAAKLFPERSLKSGQEVDIALVPSPTRPDKKEPIAFSVYEGGEGTRLHRVTVARTAAGEYRASTERSAAVDQLKTQPSDGGQSKASNLYASVYYVNLLQQIEPETILKILKIHAYGTDFSRRIRAGDQVELFFDPRDDDNVDGPPGELLSTSITASGETKRFYRFRASDGTVDFYDAAGNNSKNFLMRRPVRGEDVRLTSGFGVRFHPLLGERKMHTGVDWAAPPGTPILAAGNGTIEEAGRKGQYGNYVRIRHANGYQTTYGHMQRIAAGVEEGVKVIQGQVIGYVGSTGLSSGPHLHFEILVNTRFVDPTSFRPDPERQLSGKDLDAFQKERTRIDDLMRRAPVKTEMMASR